MVVGGGVAGSVAAGGDLVFVVLELVGAGGPRGYSDGQPGYRESRPDERAWSPPVRPQVALEVELGAHLHDVGLADVHPSAKSHSVSSPFDFHPPTGFPISNAAQ